MMENLRPTEIWMLQSEDSSYCALVVYRKGGPRQYAPEDKRALLHAQGIGMFTFQPDGLLCEGTSVEDLGMWLRAQLEIIAPGVQMAAYYASKAGL